MKAAMRNLGWKTVVFTLSAWVLAWAPAWATSWENVTVVTVDGWEYPNMFVAGAAGQDVVVMTGPDGGHRKMPRSRIRVIRDAEGRDITQAVFSAPGDGAAEPIGTAPDGEPDRPADGALAPATVEAPTLAAEGQPRRPLRYPGPRDRFKFVPSFAVGYGQASGDWFDGLTSGLAIEGKMRVMVSEAAYVGFGYRHQSVGVESSLEYLYDTHLAWDVVLGEYFFSVGVISHPDKPTAPLGYFEAGMGIINHEMSATILGDPLYPDPALDGISLSTSESKLGFLLEGGVLIPLQSKVALDLGANLRMTSNGEADEQEVFGLIFGCRAGIALLLGQ